MANSTNNKPRTNQQSKFTDVEWLNKLLKKEIISEKLLITFDKSCTLSQTTCACNDYSQSNVQNKKCKRCRKEILGLTEQEHNAIFYGETPSFFKNS